MAVDLSRRGARAPRATPGGLDLADVAPMLLGERRAPFEAPGWTAELKFDGYRLLAGVRAGAVQLKTRNGADATRWYPELQVLAALPGNPILDGEVAVLDELGRSDFNRTHARSLRRGRPPGADAVVFCAFDLLAYRGRDLRARPLASRKAQLAQLLATPLPSVLYVQDVPGGVAWLYAQAVALELEGIVAKRLDSPYRSGQRSDDWLKIKRPGATPARRFQR
jgi:bifunctional non-homologous end joining protein LigD